MHGFVKQTPSECSCNDRESVIRVRHFSQEEIVSVRQLLLVSPKFAYDSILTCTAWTLGVRVRKTTNDSRIGQLKGMHPSCADLPLMVAMLAHVVNSR